MRHRLRTGALLIGLLASTQAGAELRGKVEARFDYYPQAPQHEDQSSDRLQPSFASELNLRKNLGNDTTATLSLFGKFHPDADREYSGDVREAWLGYYGDRTEWRAGILLERWGLLEAENIVDIINPRDAVEDFQGDVKLGIPGASFSYLADEGQFSVWLLPYARERRLARGKDRFRTSPLSFRGTDFESGRRHPSVAIRASAVRGELDVAVSHFYGHSRTPRFEPEVDGFGRPTDLRPTYDLINQTNLELLWVQGHSLWKLEAFYQLGPEDDFFGIGAGVEREVPRLWNSKASLTFYAEGYYDDRDESAPVPIAPFQQDVFLGARLALNDLNRTEFQVRLTYDLEHEAALLDLRAERRLDRVWGMEASLYTFISVENDPALNTFRNDDRVQLKLIRNF